MLDRFEKVGAVIFATHRLAGALDALSDWLIRKSAARGTCIDAALPHRDIACLYFEGNTHLEKEKAALFSFFDDVALITAETADLRTRDDAGIDASRARLKELHFALADLFQTLGYAEFPPERLRQQARRLSS